MVEPYVIEGGKFTDVRGSIMYNNTVNLSQIKRMYTITNTEDIPVRAWQGLLWHRYWSDPIF